jgi:triacylglycerol lipase
MFHVKRARQGEPDTAESINLKYPLILVHGAGLRDKTFGINYWGRIPRYLAERGVKVYYGGTGAWNVIEKNGETLKQTVRSVLAKTGAEKVVIIAHSRGGLEARYAIGRPGMAGKVAALVTMSTPHRGAKAMNVALKFPRRLYRFVSFFVNCWSRILGDTEPDFYTGSRQLSEKWCAEFNRNNPDSGEVCYQSYAAKLRFFFGDLYYLLPYILVRIFDGDNDGLCPVESAVWGDFRGIVTTRGIFGISHGGILDFYRVRYKGVDIPELYADIVRDLAAKGF